MKWYYYVLIFLVVLAIIFWVVEPIIQNKKVYKLLSSNQISGDKKLYDLIVTKKKEYDYVLKCEKINIYLKIAVTPSNSQICINAKETWQLNYGGSRNNHGRVYPNKRFMDELIHYLKNDITNDEKALKVILVYKRVEGIVRYLNESELETVDIKKTPYGYKIMQYDTFKEELEYILNEGELNNEKK